MRLRKRYVVPMGMKIFLLLVLVSLIALLMGCSISRQGDFGTDQTGTVQKLLQTALEPMGSTMYVWGGGWDSGDAKAGKSAARIGVSPQWTEFASEQDASYDFEEHLEEQDKGLDCSGYVGWVMYNLFEDRDGEAGYVTLSTGMAADFASRGWGKLIINPYEFLPGDIVSMQGHVWICLGTCEDGSVLLIHSSPPGVSVCGTVVPGASREEESKETPRAADERATSIAITLAKDFMSAKYPDWQEKYPNRAVSEVYLENVSLLRWNEKTLGDAQEYQSMTGEEIMEILSGI